MNLLLLGLRGSGKSTLGPRLALAAGCTFVDLDALTARTLNAPSAGEALRSNGEEHFRRAEACALRVLLGRDDQVIALGGGTPTAPGVAELLRTLRSTGGARLCYLRAAPETLRERLQATDTASRPSLTGLDPLDEIPVLFQARDPLYRELADTVVEVDAVSEDQALTSLASWAQPHPVR